MSSPLQSGTRKTHTHTHTHTPQTPLLLSPPCLLLSATPASRIPAFLQLSSVGNEFYHQPETKPEDKQQKKVSRAEICAGLGSVLTCLKWKLYEVTVSTPNMLLSRGLRWRHSSFFPPKIQLNVKRNPSNLWIYNKICTYTHCIYINTHECHLNECLKLYCDGSHA